MQLTKKLYLNTFYLQTSGGKRMETKPTRKAQLTQRGTLDSDACANARCERNLSSQRCFI